MQDKVSVPCPHCGHAQLEPPAAYSTVCKKCGRHYRVHEALNPVEKPPEFIPEHRRIACPECSERLEVALAAQSTMCKRCGRYIDLKDYRIASAVSKNFKTLGTFIVEPAGYVFNTEANVGDAVIKGRFLGKLIAQRSLTVYSTAEIKGSFSTAQLIIPPGNHFAWKDPIHVASAEIAGELSARLQADGTVELRPAARLFGEIEAKNLVVAEGAVIVGRARIGAARRRAE
jgi:cytoskeletal protein CcmA (bactofilin family)/DNA-directed RNA polymerase subunit RPC12/RpoP